MAVLEYDAIVDAARQGNYLTVQAADDALDGGACMLYVKSGTYAGFTVSTNNVVVTCEPGTVFTSSITLSGAGVCLILGAGCDVQALITLSGVGNSLLCENGVDLDGVELTGNACLVDGGGWDTISDGGTAVRGINIITGEDSIVQNIACTTTAGGASDGDAIGVQGLRAIVSQCKVIDSDDVGIFNNTAGATDVLVEGCVVLGADTLGIQMNNGPRARIIGNYVVNAGTDGIFMGPGGDDTVALGNIVQDHGGDSIGVAATGENCVVHENRLDGAVSDNSGTSVVAHNDTEAF